MAATLALASCGSDDDKDLSPGRVAFEGAEVIQAGPNAFLLRLDTGELSAKQRKDIGLVSGGKWVESGLVVTPNKLDGMCDVRMLSRESCKAVGR